MKKIMLLEPNPYHSEILPGIVKYFEDLGYIVDVYIRKEVIQQNVFCRYKLKGNIIGYSLDEIRDLCNSEQMKKYYYLFLSSMEHSENGQIKRFLDEMETIPKTLYGILGMFHTNWLIDTFHDYQMLHEKRLFVISAFQTKGYVNANILPPVFFGDTRIKRKKSSGKIKLLTVGGGMDILMLQEAYWKLTPNERKKIEIRWIGAPRASLKKHIYNIVTHVRGTFLPQFRPCKNFVNLGRLTFDQMYTEVEKADFVLVLLDPNQDNHKHYISASTSGIRQLILGFSKICIIHNKIAGKYGLDSNMCIEFESHNMYKAVKQAVHMQQKEFIRKTHMIQKYRNNLFRHSRNNLKELLREKETVQ